MLQILEIAGEEVVHSILLYLRGQIGSVVQRLHVLISAVGQRLSS